MLRTEKTKISIRVEQVLVVFTLLTITLAFFIGRSLEKANYEPHLYQAFPQSDQFEKKSSRTFEASIKGTSIGYVVIAENDGFGGPLVMATALDLNGKIAGLSVVKQRETPSWYQRVVNGKLLESMVGKSYQDGFEVGKDIDGISGATYTSTAVIQSVGKGARLVASQHLGFEVPKPEKPDLVFGIPEILLVVLFVSWIVGGRLKAGTRSKLRWVSLVVGMIFLGFIYNSPLNLPFVNRLLLGFWPTWQIHLYWYILIGFLVLAFVWDGKNPYCYWICPTGAAQECLNSLANAKARNPRRFLPFFKWAQRGIAWAAIITALLFRNPGVANYEISGNLFDLRGSAFQFVILALVGVASIFIKRPWCRFLCPIRPLYDFIRFNRNWMKQIWNQNLRKSAAE